MKRELERIEIPGEHDAREHTWQVVSSAFVEREPTAPRPARRLVPVLAAVFVAAIVAAAVSPPGRAVFHAIRETVGVEKAQPALFSLPAAGRLLVTSDAGVWVVQADGSKRLLGHYAEASWSPFGRFVAASRDNVLYALTPTGEERWSLARSNVRFPRWAGSRTDTTIAYLSGSRPRLVAGDGTADRPGCATRVSHVAAAWSPVATARTLALVAPDGRVSVYDAGPCTLLWRVHPGSAPTKLEWSSDGRLLLAFAPSGLRVYDSRGRVVAQDDPSDATRDVDATFLPGTHELAVVRAAGASSSVFLLHDHTARTLFSGTGDFTQLVPSPDGRFLLVAWRTADQWVFVPISGGRLRAVANVSAQFRSRDFPRVEGWAR